MNIREATHTWVMAQLLEFERRIDEPSSRSERLRLKARTPFLTLEALRILTNRSSDLLLMVKSAVVACFDPPRMLSALVLSAVYALGSDTPADADCPPQSSFEREP